MCGIIFGDVTVVESLEGKVVEGICTRIDGCRIIDNVCVDCLTVKNYWGLLTGDDMNDL